ncbi:MAG: UDP-3-O-(3-hydroxymyristoyl)glucosamine N-acyltransferase [Ottowia sp.]|nr:UDP-3-O-(3-hydroxymyristoyl)glucosamine N-acyltransferase [Ottowia sp.]
MIGPNVLLHGVAPLHRAGSGELAFLSNPRYVEQVAQSRAGAVLVHRSDLAKLQHRSTCSWLVVANPYACFARAAQLFSAQPAYQPGRCASADIDASAQVPQSCQIGPFVSIGPGVVLGERVKLLGHTHIGAGVRIGDDTLIYSRVSVYDACVIGARCIVHSGAVIGSDGFGFAPDFSSTGGQWVKIPQTGRAVLGDDVELGANSTIDRGAMDDTVIEMGCKIDNQVQIAHNVRVGAFTVIAGTAAIAGSTTIGKYCMVGGAANIAGHLTIADKVIISGGTAITKSIPAAGHFTAVFPFMPHSEWEKNAAVLKQLSKLRARLRQIEFAFFNKK